MEKERTFDGIGGVKIATRTWLPASSPRAVVLLIHGFNSHSGYFSWAAEEVLKAAARLKENMPKIKVPVLIIHGTDDKATRYQGSQYFYDHVGSEDKTLKLYEGGYHDLLNDIDKETVIADILAWVDQRVPVKTAASA